MTMVDIQAKNSLVSLLGSNSNGEYQVIGYESLAKGAKDYEGKNRTVRCFLSKGEFPRSGGSLTTPCKHNVGITLEMVCTAASQIDLGVIDNPESTASQRAIAMAGATPAAQLVDEYWDEFRGLLWNLIMAGGNRWLGLDKYIVTDRFVTKWEKDRLVPMGEYCILTGYMMLEFSVTEKTDRAKAGTPFESNTRSLTTDDGEIAQTVMETEE